MAMICVTGVDECTGVGKCQSKQSYLCPNCGKIVEEKLYVQYGEVIGCDRCISVKNYYE